MKVLYLILLLHLLVQFTTTNCAPLLQPENMESLADEILSGKNSELLTLVSSPSDNINDRKRRFIVLFIPIALMVAAIGAGTINGERKTHARPVK